MNRFSMYVTWSNEDQAFIALCDEFPEASAFGESREEALKELVVALELLAENYQDEKRPLPKPKVFEEYSGQFRVRVPKFLHRQLANEALSHSVSLNTLVNAYLSLGLGRQAEVSEILTLPVKNAASKKLV